MKNYSYRSVLSIAGSDSGGGAGIQGDLKTFSALGCYGTTAITAITVQNTLGVHDIHCIPACVVSEQIRTVMDDLKPLAIKIGMVPTREVADVIAKTLQAYHVPIVFDPVMISGSGRKLVTDETIEVFKTKLFPLCSLITPNINEATAMTGISINKLDDMKLAACEILKTGCKAVLVTGGHLRGFLLQDVLLDRTGFGQVFTSDFIKSKNLHGTGCTLSSAVAAFIAEGLALPQAIEEAIKYVQHAIEHGKDVLSVCKKTPQFLLSAMLFFI